MEEINQSSKRNIGIIIAILLIIFIFHLFLLLLIFYFDTHQLNKAEPVKQKLIQILPNKPLKKQEKSKTVQTPNTQTEFPSVKQKSGIPIFSDHEKNELQKNIEERTPKSLDKLEELFKDKALDSSKEKKLAKSKNLNPSTIQEKQVVQEKIDEIKMQDKLDSSIKAGEKLENETTPPKLKKRSIMSYDDSAKPILPASFVEGFLNVPEGGQHAYTFLSDKNLNKTNFKTVCYIDKVFTFMQNSWNVNKQKIKNHKAVATNIGISLVLNEDGKIISLEKTYPSPYQEIDDIVLETIKNAAPYPPIPKHLNKEIFKIDTTIHVTLGYKY